MTGRLYQGASRAILCVLVIFFVTLAPRGADASPYADMVIDARSGEVLHATNADSRLHPASLTKMMTLYVTFEAIRLGEISLDTVVTISSNASAEPPSKLGLRTGQRIQLRYLIRAAAVKSANDAATALGEAVAGSEAAFARRMNRTALALGMTRTTFKNAHGLTESGHLSTARDMTALGRHLFFDYPQYYNLFSRRSADAGVTQVNNTNRRFLDAYEGADGIKTGYTRAAGFNLVASAERGSERIIATVFGGTSTPNRNARVAELLDLGFKLAPTRVAVNRPRLPRYDNLPPEPVQETVVVAEAGRPEPGAAGRVLRMSGAVTRSPRPLPRGGAPVEEPPAALLAAIETDIAAAIASVAAADAVSEAADIVVAETAAEEATQAVTELAEAEVAPQAAVEPEAIELAGLAALAPPPRPEDFAPEAVAETELAEAVTDPVIVAETAEAAPEPVVVAEAAATEPAAKPLETAATEIPTTGAEAPAEILMADVTAGAIEDTEAGAGEYTVMSLLTEAAPSPADASAPEILLIPEVVAELPAEAEAAPLEAEPAPVEIALAAPLPPLVPEPVIRPEPVAAETVTRLSTSGGRHSGISLGRYPSRSSAEKALITMSLSDMTGLGGALRRIVQRSGAYEANFMGMSSEEAALACRRIASRGTECTLIGE